MEGEGIMGKYYLEISEEDWPATLCLGLGVRPNTVLLTVTCPIDLVIKKCLRELLGDLAEDGVTAEPEDIVASDAAAEEGGDGEWGAFRSFINTMNLRDLQPGQTDD